MPRYCTLLTSLALVASMPAIAGDGPGQLYKWVDDQGVVHYGDRVPPQYAQQQSTVLNKQGVVVGHVDAAKTDAQLSQEASIRDQAAKQQQHDAFLLATYTSVRDIEALRDERLNQLHDQEVATQQYTNTLSERLATLQTRASNFKPYSSRPDARKMPDDLAEQMVHTMNDIRTQKAALVTDQQNETTVRQQFQADIERYKELRAAQASVH